MVVRTEVNAFMKPDGKKKEEQEKEYVAIHALNEYDPKPETSWRKTLDSQRGMVLATQLKNNAFKLARWTAQALISGCHYIKLGFVTRQTSKDPWSHNILAVQTYRTEAFASQIGLTDNNIWGIVRSMVDVVKGFDDGKYLLLKDPTKTIMRFYKVPFDSFDDDDDDSDYDEFDEDEDEA